MMLQDLIKGQMKPSNVKIFVISTFTSLLLMVFAAWFIYPSELAFHIMTHPVSYLGIPGDSQGWLLFSIAILFLSITMVPLIRYVYPRIKAFHPRTSKVGRNALYVGCIGLIGVACLPITALLRSYHYTAAYIGFGGNIVGMTAWGYVYASKENPANTTKGIFRIVYILFLISATGLLVFAPLGIILGYELPAPGIFSFPMWEWFLFVLAIVAFDLLVFLVAVDED